MRIVMATVSDISVREAAKQLGVTQSTVMRWILQGVNGKRLDGWKLGQSWFTSQAAIEEFRTRPQQAVAIRTKVAARQAYERALEI